MAKRMSSGKCNLCGGTFSKSAMTKHLKLCKQQKEGFSKTPASARSPQKTKTFHLVVEGRYLPDYWMHLEVPANAKLEALDCFLRDIWLECCGHLSAFTIADRKYSVAPMAEFDDKSMNIKLDRVLEPGMKFFHEYDFGTTTDLMLKVVSEGESELKDQSIQVLARNEPPAILCESCGKMATQVCTECLWSGEGKGWLCDQCAAKHKCGEELLLPVVNSPRVGMCGYTGD